LAPAFLAVLKECDQKTWLKLQKQVPFHARDSSRDPWWDSEDSDELLTQLFDALNACAPEGHYFGAHSGDGSDFGFWPVDDE
jgi:hypothetical protein